MRHLRAWVLLALAGPPAAAWTGAGCSTPPAPDEEAGERFEEGNHLLDQGRYADAIPHYVFAISMRDRMKPAYHKLAYCHEALGDESRAVETLEKLLRVDRHDAYALRHLWRLYLHRGQVAPALEACRTLQEHYRHDPGLAAEIARLEGLKSTK